MEPDGKDGFSYDVAFSFAGEDREYVERVAKAVEGKVQLFYDRHEQTDLWGKNLYTHLGEIYGQKSRFCVMFISEHYARKLWTNHERESAQARAFSDHQTYILPARFDDTAIPGVLPTVGYVDLRSLSPEDFACILLEKLASSGVAERRHSLPAPVSPRRRRWLVATPALVLIVIALGGVVSVASEARRPKVGGGGEDAGARVEPRTDSGTSVAAGAQQSRSAPGRVEQVLQADGPDSQPTVEGGMNIERRTGGDSRQEVKATNGAKPVLKGGMNYTGP